MTTPEAKRTGLIVASKAAHDMIAARIKRAYRITSFSNGRSPKVWSELRAVLAAAGYSTEAVFDAAHGFRYLLFVYASPDERRACWDALTQ
jgi:hypothetical protein